MDAMEKSHEFESSIVSSLFDVRQLVWTELSSVISNIKDQFDRSNKERAGDITRLLDENQSLTEVLSRLQEIVEGKEIEIHGLRRQLQSFYAGRPMCSVCTREIKAPSGKCSFETERYLTDKRSSVRKSCPCHPCINALLEARKRVRSDSTFSSVPLDASVAPSELPKPKPSRWKLTMDSRPSTKRRCVRASVGAVSTNPDTRDCNIQKSNPDDRGNGEKTIVQADEKPCRQTLKSVGKSSPVSPKLCTFPVVDFSPPTEHYDASSAIKNAINHLDLVTCNDTQLDSVISYNAPANADTTDDQSSITLSVSACQTSKFFFRRAPVAKGRSQRVASQLLHRRLGYGLSTKRHGRLASGKGHRVINRHLQEEDCAEPKRKRNLSRFNKLDETGAELSLTSNFLESECTEIVPRSPPVNLFPTVSDISTVQLERDFAVSEKHLPSVGGSPTGRSQFLFKRPEVPPPALTSSSFAPSFKHAVSRMSSSNASLPVNDMAMQLPPSSTPHSVTNPQLLTAVSPELGHVARSTSASTPNTSEDKGNQVVCDLPMTLQPSGSKPEGSDKDELIINPNVHAVKHVGPSERSKSVRRQLTGHSCAQCEEYYESIGLTRLELGNRIQRCSRHRALHGAPPSTPKGFWEIGISDSECKENSPVKHEVSNKRYGFRRRRPLNFPVCSLSPASNQPSKEDRKLRDSSNKATNNLA